MTGCVLLSRQSPYMRYGLGFGGWVLRYSLVLIAVFISWGYVVFGRLLVRFLEGYL